MKIGTRGWVMVVIGLAALAGAGPPVEPYEIDATTRPAAGAIDAIAFETWAAHDISPAHPCSDVVFLRRVYLDTIGTLPTVAEIRRFTEDDRADKRARLIDQLLTSQTFVDYWAMKWGDVLRIKAEFPINLWPNAVQAYDQWVRDSLRENRPYDQMARDLLTASGSNFRTPPVNFYRAVQSREPHALAAAVALTFMGQRTDHWTSGQRDAMATFFGRVAYKPTGEWKEEIVHNAIVTDTTPVAVTFPDGTRTTLRPDDDSRQVFANWLIHPDNPWFARVMANRVWFWLLGRGLVHEPDDFRPDNPAAIPALLDHLAGELVRSGYDLRHLYRLILNSQVYQLSFIPQSDSPDAAKLFAYYPPRRMEAEVLIDAIIQITGSHEQYFSQIPEPFTIIPDPHRSINLTDGSTTSSFLDLFGRPARDTGLLLERNDGITAPQSMHLLNATHIRRKLEQGPTLRALIRKHRNNTASATPDIYLTLLSRPPTERELQTLKEHTEARKSARPGEVLADLVWALINSPEFLYRH